MPRREIAQPPAEDAQPPSRAELRLLLDQILPESADFDAFCINHFFSVHRRFTSGMDRVSRSNLLLTLAPLDELFAHLIHRSTDLAKASAVRAGGPGHYAQTRYALERDLEYLRLCRAIAKKHSLDIQGLQESMNKLRLRLRSGPYLSEGEVILERFRLLHQLGEGGVARVWLAECLSDTESKAEVVALKVLRDVREQSRFENGARRMKQLPPHAHILQLREGPLEFEGFHFFTMDYAPGGELGRAVIDKRVAPERAFQVLLDVAAALEHSHKHGLIHRDVKPSNILLTSDQRGLLSDFDLAYHIDTSGGARTNAGGTARYMAPELQDPSATPTEQADVFSLGMTAMFVLHRKPLSFPERQFDQFKNMGGTAAVKAVIYQAVEIDLGKRFANVRAFRQELEKALRAPEPQADSLPSTVLKPAALLPTAPVPALPAEGTAPTLSSPAQPADPAVPLSLAVWLRSHRYQLAILLIALAIGAFSVGHIHKLYTSGGTDRSKDRPGLIAQNVPKAATVSLPADAAITAGELWPDSPLQTPLGKVLIPLRDPATPVPRPRLPTPVKPTATRAITCTRPEGETLDSGSRSEYKLEVEIYEVTTAQYEDCVRRGVCKPPVSMPGCNYGILARQADPINCVSFAQATTFCAQLHRRLPTAAELDTAYGSRAYPWGSTQLNAEHACWARAKSQGTCPVGQKAQGHSKDGIFDLLGNVWEWTTTQPQKPEGGSQPGSRLVVGGGWNATKVTTIPHSPRNEDEPLDNIGFRCVK